MDPNDLANFSKKIDLILQSLGTYDKTVQESEHAARLYARRSLVTRHAIKKGTNVTREMLTFKRPGTGISPSQISMVLVKKTAKNLQEDHILSWDDLQ